MSRTKRKPVAKTIKVWALVGDDGFIYFGDITRTKEQIMRFKETGGLPQRIAHIEIKEIK